MLIMDEIDTILDQLEDDRLAYVQARIVCKNDAEAIRQAGISRGTFYTWSQDERDRLANIVHSVQRSAAKQALLVFKKNGKKAADKIVKLIDSRNENVALAAAREVSDRVIGKVPNNIDLTTGGDKIEPVKIIEVVKDHGQ